ncbi:hypothetical protein BH09SUM1_BH09SUM1_05220 [soil metagenome]
MGCCTASARVCKGSLMGRLLLAMLLLANGVFAVPAPEPKPQVMGACGTECTGCCADGPADGSAQFDAACCRRDPQPFVPANDSRVQMPPQPTAKFLPHRGSDWNALDHFVSPGSGVVASATARTYYNDGPLYLLFCVLRN